MRCASWRSNRKFRFKRDRVSRRNLWRLWGDVCGRSGESGRERLRFFHSTTTTSRSFQRISLATICGHSQNPECPRGHAFPISRSEEKCQEHLQFFWPLFVFVIATQAQSLDEKGFCDSHPQLCTEKQDIVDYAGNYVGHDEPSLLFYSNKKGSGNTNLYFITLPKDPRTFPNQAGTAGTANFQLHPAFWFGMAMCDSQSSPNFTNVCNPDTDANIFDNPNPLAEDYIGHHPGVAFMEMQFYPPGWVLWPAGNSCDAFKWCAALNIDSLSEKVVATGTQFNNLACRTNAGDEYVNFAFLTNNGVAQDAADPQKWIGRQVHRGPQPGVLHELGR